MTTFSNKSGLEKSDLGCITISETILGSGTPWARNVFMFGTSSFCKLYLTTRLQCFRAKMTFSLVHKVFKEINGEHNLVLQATK